MPHDRPLISFTPCYKLEQCGWRVLRFWNEDVVKDMHNVCLHIIRTVKESQP
jgi:very-short-patch-repair endonuclease